MTTAKRVLCAFYALIALAALYGTWSENLAYVGSPSHTMGAFLSDLKVNPASRSISVDLVWFLLAAVFLMALEARRVGLRFVWAYVLFAYTIAISVTFPLFLLAREIRMASAQPAAPQSLTILDGIGLAALTALSLYLAIWLH